MVYGPTDLVLFNMKIFVNIIFVMIMYVITKIMKIFYCKNFELYSIHTGLVLG